MSALEQTRDTLVNVLVELETMPGNCELVGTFCDGTEWDRIDQAIAELKAVYSNVSLSLDSQCRTTPTEHDIAEQRERLLREWNPEPSSDLSGLAARETPSTSTTNQLLCKCGHKLSPEVVTDVHGSYRACMGCGNYIEIEEEGQ